MIWFYSQCVKSYLSSNYVNDVRSEALANVACTTQVEREISHEHGLLAPWLRKEKWKAQNEKKLKKLQANEAHIKYALTTNTCQHFIKCKDRQCA